MLDLNFRQTAQPVRKLWPRPWEFTASFDLLRVFCVCLQCFDAVGWAAGRASGL